MGKNFFEFHRNKKHVKGQSSTSVADDKIGSKVYSRELNRRDFMKLSALMAGEL